MKWLTARNFTTHHQSRESDKRLFSLLFALPLLFSLSGCVTSFLKLPPQDKILKLQIDDNVIKAESEHYGYFFNLKREENRKAYFQYQQFMKTYQNEIEGYFIQFTVDMGSVNIDVVATYNLILKPMPDEQLENLKSHYRVITLTDGKDKNRNSVQFQAEGIVVDFEENYRKIRWEHIDNRYRLNTPILVNINDQSKTLSDLSTIFVVPFYPMIMMYGCATSRCV